jgi:hypothetical protein
MADFAGFTGHLPEVTGFPDQLVGLATIPATGYIIGCHKKSSPPQWGKLTFTLTFGNLFVLELLQAFDLRLKQDWIVAAFPEPLSTPSRFPGVYGVLMCEPGATTGTGPDGSLDAEALVGHVGFRGVLGEEAVELILIYTLLVGGGRWVRGRATVEVEAVLVGAGHPLS